jgi:phosphoglycolate phosphatase
MLMSENSLSFGVRRSIRLGQGRKRPAHQMTLPAATKARGFPPRRERMGTVIFDLDGTLADTSGDLIAAANACFRDMGHGDVLDPARDAGVALRGGRRMLSHGLERLGRFDEDMVTRYYPVLLDAYEGAIDTHTVLYPGAMEAVAALGEAGYRVGICTNKPAALAELLLTRMGIRGAFASMIGADTLRVRKPDPEPLREAVRRAGGDPAACVLVGDSDTDRNTARAAGVPSILVTFGPSGADMAALEPEGLLDRYDDLPDMVTRLIGQARATA